MSKRAIQFLSNDALVSIDNIDPNTTVLEYLREEQYKSGTKEGCASGDCGACTVVVAELDAENNNELSYKSINACISFVGSLHGKQLITVEDLKQGAELHHVQKSMVDNHASQCGFCTPGFVMSAFALHKETQKPTRHEVVEALAGNLCRCTGYRSIIDAALVSSENAEPDSFSKFYQDTVTQLQALQQQELVELNANKKHYFAPTKLTDLANFLQQHPQATLVAGATDLALAVTQQFKSFDQLVYLGDVNELNQMDETSDSLSIGAAVPYSQFTPLLAAQYSDLGEMIERIGSRQIRNNGTLGGNIGNASPIGDMPPALIALGADLVLHKAGADRTIKLEDYFVDYKKTVLAPSEFIKEVIVPKAKADQHLKLYKISKRIDDDISAVLAAFNISLENDTISAITMAFGGMAATPKRALHCEQALLGKCIGDATWQQTLKDAKAALKQDFSPMSDVRASDEYRMRVAQNLIEKCFIELQHRNIETRVVNYA